MITMNEKDLNNLKSDLVSSLTKLSNGNLKLNIAQKIADKSLNNIDLSNSALVHKGTNWYAKELLKVIKY